MNPIIVKIGVIVVLFVVIFSLGYWLHHFESPYPTGLLTIHKLLSLGLMVYLIRWVLQLHQLSPMPQTAQLLLVGAGVLFIFTIISGGFQSMAHEWPPWVSLIHHISPYLTIVFTGWGLYLILV